MKRSLLIGAGSRRDYIVPARPGETDYGKLVTLDIEPRHNPDVVWDLRKRPWPFEDNRFDEVHAYEVLEHLGRQGDVDAFFADFGEIYRILRPGGRLCASVPNYMSEWAWGDPSHTRVITPGTLVFLSQAEYANQVGKTAMSDFRSLWRGDFKTVSAQMSGSNFFFCLEAIK